MSSEIAIRVENLHKHYLLYTKPSDRLKQMFTRGRRKYFREHPALGGVSLTVRRGETVGIIGRNGSGKSTLLQIIAGTLSPTSGTCDVRGRISALLELGAGFNPEFTGEENIRLNAAILGLSPEEIHAAYDGIVKFAGIGEFLARPVKTYSSGMAVRLAFAIAVAVNPDILIVDEALAVGDEAFQAKCHARLREMKAHGATILFVSHAAGTVVEVCDRAVLFDGGELLLEGDPKQVVAHYHKLIFAAADKQPQVREELKKLAVLTAEGATRGDAPEAHGFHDPRLAAETTVAYPSRGARIENPRLLDVHGNTVNLLHRRGEYVFTYDVTFDAPASEVRFGMMLKTNTGYDLGGTSALKPSAVLPRVAAGARYRVAYRFDCRLMQGAYFLNCGCSGMEDGERVFLHRLVDAVMFKVLPEPDLRETGPIDFAIEPSVEELTNVLQKS